MGSIIRKELKLMLRAKGNFFWLLGMPIGFILLFASIFSNTDSNLNIHVIDQDRSAQSVAFLKQLDQIKGVDVTKDTDLSQQVEQIKQGKLSTLLVIPSGFGDSLQKGEQTTLQLHRDVSSNEVAAAVQAVVEGMANQYREIKLQQVLGHMVHSPQEVAQITQPPVKVETINEISKKVDAITQVVPGYTVMFVFFIIITMVRRFIREKESGMVARLQSMSIRPSHYLIGMWVPNLIAVLIQSTVLLSFGHFVYGLVLGNIAAIALLVLALSICGTGMGLAVSFLVGGENQGIAITQLIALGGAMLGGLWVPYDLLPTFIQQIGHFIPQYWGQHGLQDVMIRGAGVGDIVTPLLILLAFGIGGLIIALLRFPRFIQSALH